MVTIKQIQEGWTNIRISFMTVKRLRVLKAQHDYAHFDELINKALDFFEGDLDSGNLALQVKGSKKK